MSDDSKFEFRTQAYDKCPKCGGFVDTRGGPQSGRLCIKCAADEIARLHAERAELIGALERIANMTAGGPHPSPIEGMGAALASLDRARDIARDAAARAQSDPHDSEGETG